MTRVILIAVALVGALIALLVWISSPADDRLKTQNELIDGKVNSLGRRTGERPRVAANWPRKAAHVLIQIAYPKDDPRAARGGATLASLRGNGVTYRRKSVNEAALERHRVSVAAVEGALAVRTAVKYVAHGKIEGDIIQLVVKAEAPAIENTPPAKYNYMPHAPAIGADGVASTKIWGDTADEICAAG